MTDITKSIITWVECCQIIWKQYFAHREYGDDEFINVEKSLLESLVLSDLLKNDIRIDLDNFWDFIHVEYIDDISGYRQFFVVNKHGNILGEPKTISSEKGSRFSVQYIDPTGTMNEGVAYIEVKCDQGFFIESLDLVKVLIDAPKVSVS